MLIGNLPPDSATARANTPAHGSWTQTDELLATTAEVLAAKLDQVASFVHGMASMFADKPPAAYEPAPFKIPRPEAIEKLREEAPPEVRKQSSMAEVAAFFRGARSSVA